MPPVSERGCLVIADPAARVVVRRHRLFAAGAVHLFAFAAVQARCRATALKNGRKVRGHWRLCEKSRYTVRLTDPRLHIELPTGCRTNHLRKRQTLTSIYRPLGFGKKRISSSFSIFL